MKYRIPQTGTTYLPYTLHSCQTRSKQGIAIMDARAAFFHTLAPTPSVQSRRRRQACQLSERVNAITSPAVPPSMDPSWRSTSRPTSCPAATPATGAARRSTWWPHCAASLFENKPESCPSGHQLWPGKAQVSWTPCVCEPAREAAAAWDNVRVACNSCHDQLRQTVFFEPPHDRGHRRLTVWVTEPRPRR
jgi:hypothetical protein